MGGTSTLCAVCQHTHTLLELNSVRYHVASCKMFSCPPPVLSVICWSLRDSREALTLATRTAQQCRDVSCDRCGVASTTIAEHGTNLLTDRTCVRYAGFCVLVWGELMFGKRGGRNEIMTWRPYFPRAFSPNVGFPAMSLLQFLAVSCICQFCHEEVAVSLHLFSTGASWPVMNHTLFEPFTMSVS